MSFVVSVLFDDLVQGGVGGVEGDHQQCWQTCKEAAVELAEGMTTGRGPVDPGTAPTMSSLGAYLAHTSAARVGLVSSSLEYPLQLDGRYWGQI